MPKQITLDKITASDDVQQRAGGVNVSIVGEYAAAIESGDDFPPVVVFYDGDANWLADGFHRYEAHVAVDANSIACDIRKGTKRDAILYACGCNGDHGLRRTNADKRKSVRTLLDDATWGKRSNRWIAEKAGVSDMLVADVKTQLQESCSSHSGGGELFDDDTEDDEPQAEPPATTGRDGKTRQPPKKQQPPKQTFPAVLQFEQLMLSIGAIHDELLAKYDHSVDAMVTSNDWNMDWTGVAINYVSETEKLCKKLKKELEKYVEVVR